MSQPLWADAVFVRDPTRLQNWSEDDLLIGARLLRALFGSYDLALQLLAAHGTRCVRGLANGYVSALREENSIAAAFFSAAD
jgi:hypothetical protein